MNLHHFTNLTLADAEFVDKAINLLCIGSFVTESEATRLHALLVQLDTELTAATDRADRAEDQVRDLQSRIEELV